MEILFHGMSMILSHEIRNENFADFKALSGGGPRRRGEINPYWNIRSYAGCDAAPSVNFGTVCCPTWILAAAPAIWPIWPGGIIISRSSVTVAGSKWQSAMPEAAAAAVGGGGWSAVTARVFEAVVTQPTRSKQYSLSYISPSPWYQACVTVSVWAWTNLIFAAL